MKNWLAALACVALCPSFVWAAESEESAESESSSPQVVAQVSGPSASASGASSGSANSASAPVENPAAAAPAPAAASSTRVLVNTPQQEAARTGLFINAGVEQFVGSGTFVNPDFYGSMGLSVLFAPTYNFSANGLPLIVGLRQMAQVQYLRPVDNPTGRRFDFSDTRLSLTAPVLLTEKFTGIAFTPTFSFTLPISYDSRMASTITRLALGARLTRSLWRFDLTYSLGGARSFHANPAIVQFAAPRDPQGNLVALCRDGQSFCGSAGMNAAWSMANTFSLNFRATDTLWLQTSWDFVKAWRYPVTNDVNDPLTSKAVDSNGNPVAKAGWTSGDTMSGTVSANWAFSTHFGLGAGVSTTATPLTADNKAIRFPFFDFLGPAESTTTYSVSLQASF
jgi:hypothetical protein